jgi:CBS domain-containing protein
MDIREIVTTNVATCTPGTRLSEVARMMVTYDCGAIPVIENADNMRLVGIVTDRDIVTRAVAEGRNPLDMSAREVMSQPVVAATPDMSVEAAANLMAENQVRRLPVVDSRGACVGIVAQADIALNAPVQETAEVVKEVSQPVNSPSAVDTYQ